MNVYNIGMCISEIGFRNRVYSSDFPFECKELLQEAQQIKIRFHHPHISINPTVFIKTLSVKQSPSHNTPTRFSHNTGTEEKCVPPKHRKALNFQFFAILYFQCTTQQCQNADDRDISSIIRKIRTHTDSYCKWQRNWCWETLPALRLSNQRRDTCQIYILTGWSALFDFIFSIFFLSKSQCVYFYEIYVLCVVILILHVIRTLFRVEWRLLFYIKWVVESNALCFVIKSLLDYEVKQFYGLSSYVPGETLMSSSSG